MDHLTRGVALLIGLALLVATLSAFAVLVHGNAGRPSPWRPVGEVVLLSAAWLLANGPYEGRILWRPWQDHGLTTGDLLAVPPLLVAALVALLRSH